MIGYVSDERYLAINGVDIEASGEGRTVLLRSGPSGAIRGDLPPGRYRVILAAPGYGTKRVDADLGGSPRQFRLLADQLLGYIWPKWLRAGEPGSLRIHSPKAYRLSLWRYGLDASEVRLVGWLDEHGPRAMVQTTPDGDYTQTGMGWQSLGDANAAYRRQIAAPEQSGLYYFHAETEEGDSFTFPWVVAPRRPSSPIAVLASTNTWSAYNNFGGRSNYINIDGLPSTPILVAREDLKRYAQGSFSEQLSPDEAYPPLSFERPEPLNQVRIGERPTDPIRGRQTCHLAPAEWRLLSWMERQGLIYDLYAEAQLHDGTLDLDRYRVLILSTHPEYWSAAMFDAVQRWVDERGGHLLYLGGNGLDCEVEFLDASRLHFLTHDPGEHASRMDRTHGSPASVLGVQFTGAGAMTAAPYRVLTPDHWVFQGTGLRAGQTFGHASLHERCPGGASGHETDKTNGRTPAGTTILARGCNPENGGAEMVIRDTPGGGAVFSVGSITWPASILVDESVSRITRNVIDRFLKG